MINVVSVVAGHIKPVATQVIRKVSPKLPEILLGTGIVAVAGGTAVACYRSVKETPRILAEKNETLELVHETAENKDEEKSNVVKVYFETGIELAKVYAIPVSMVCGGIACIIAAHNVQHGRILAIGSAYNTLLASFNEYRDRVREKEGVDADKRYLYGEIEEVVVEEKEDKNGKIKKKEKTVMALGSGDGESLYHRCYSKETSREWCKDPVYNLQYLKAQERIFNNQLQAEGYVFLDEVYRALGFELDGYSNAKNVGWILGMGDGYIDFGIYNPDADYVQRLENKMGIESVSEAEQNLENYYLVNGYDGKFWLDFNCDGVIIDKI